jgi:hypothetical protein
MNHVLPVLLSIAIFLAAGIWCLTKAKSIQNRAIKASENLNVRLFRGYINSRTYVVVTRIIGIVCLVVALFLVLMMFQH